MCSELMYRYTKLMKQILQYLPYETDFTIFTRYIIKYAENIRILFPNSLILCSKHISVMYLVNIVISVSAV